MKSIQELANDMGPQRQREFVEAGNALAVAKAKLAELQQKLAEHRVGQLAPSAMVTAGVNVAELAQGLQLQTATVTLITHFEKEAIPLAQRAVDSAGQVVSRLRDNRERKLAVVEVQRRIIDKAQAELERAQSWLDT